VERAKQFGDLSRRFKLGRAVLVAAPNDGTPLATPKRWDETVGWFANLLEWFPDNPFTSGVAFVANGLVWLANHASGDIPGLHAMDREGDPMAAIQAPPGPPADAYSACWTWASIGSLPRPTISSSRRKVGGASIVRPRPSFRRRASAASVPAATSVATP
jgi:hypothetical protein